MNLKQLLHRRLSINEHLCVLTVDSVGRFLQCRRCRLVADCRCHQEAWGSILCVEQWWTETTTQWCSDSGVRCWSQRGWCCVFPLWHTAWWKRRRTQGKLWATSSCYLDTACCSKFDLTAAGWIISVLLYCTTLYDTGIYVSL